MEDRHTLRDPILPVLALSTAVLVAWGSPAAAQISQGEEEATPRGLTVEEVVDFHSLVSQSPPALSPGAGSLAAYTVEGPRRTVGRTEALMGPSGDSWTELRVADTSTGEVTGLGRRSWGGSWSPDGTRLAYLVADEATIRLGIWPAARPGQPEPARTYPDAALWATWIATVPEWTPDGRRLVVKVLPEGIETREMLRRARPGFVGSGPDSTNAPADIGQGQPTVTIFRSDQVEAPRRADPPSDGPVGADPPGESQEAAASPELPEWLRWQYGGDLALVDAETGQVHRLTRGRLPMSWKISPGGRRVALLEMTGIDGGDARLALTVVSLDDGVTVELPGPVVQTWGRGLSWSPDGSRIAYLSRGDESRSGLFVADPATGTRERIAALRRGWDVEAPPVWSSSGEALLLAGTDTVWSVAAPAVAAGPDTSGPHVTPTALITFSRHRIGDLIAPRSALSLRPTDDGTLLLRVTARDAGDPGFALIDVERGRVRSIHTEPGSYGGSIRTDLASDGSSALALYSTTREAPELWRLGPGLERHRRVSSLNPGFDPASLGEDRLVQWTTGDGETLEGTLLLPPGFRDGEAVPLIVQVYGGDSGAAALDRFDRHRQLLASNGYAVLVPDVPLRVGTPMADHARAILPGIDRLIETGIADPGRIGVTGHSYGGYGTLALLVQSDRFAAAVASAAQADLVANYGHITADGSSRTRWSERGQGRMGATLWEAPERYRENSPILRLDRVTAPLLLLHGSDDPTVPVWLAEEIFSGLRRLDRPVALARYTGEGHWWGDWSVPNQVDYWSRLLGWFDHYMRPDGRSGGPR